MKLYYSPGACSLAPHIALEETGLMFTLEKVDLKSKQYSGGDYYEINPKGSVPAIKMNNGDVLTEAAVIMQYISDQRPESKFMPTPGTDQRYHAQEWLNFISTEMHKGLGVFFSLDRLIESKEGKEQFTKSQQANLGKKLDLLDKHLTKNAFLMGTTFTAPDAYLFTILRWAPVVKMDISSWKNVVAYIKRVQDRPSVQKAMSAEGLKSFNP